MFTFSVIGVEMMQSFFFAALVRNRRSTCGAEVNCNPTASSIRIFNPLKTDFIGLQILIFLSAGFQIRLSLLGGREQQIPLVVGTCFMHVRKLKNQMVP